VLSLGRNCIKKLEGLEPVAPTLKQLWVSYNVIERLVGVLGRLRYWGSANGATIGCAAVSVISCKCRLALKSSAG
jgi:hypothetical protein